MFRSKFIIALGICLYSSVVYPEAKSLDVAVGWTKPPYVIEQGNTGFEVDLVRALLNKMGYDMRPIYVPYGRSHYLLSNGKVDIAMTLNKNINIGDGVFSEPYVVYQNAAISLRGRGIKILKPADVANYSVVGFQNSHLVLGPEYGQAVKASSFYIELPDQKKQVEMLLKGKTDLVVMDINIFNYFSRELLGLDHMRNVDIHRVFAPSRYRLGFQDQKLKDEFNHTLVEFKNSIDYAELIERYEFYQ